MLQLGPYPLLFCLLCHIKHYRASCPHPLTALPAGAQLVAVACTLALPVPMSLGRWCAYTLTWALISELNVLFWLVN
jgi:hypothetical protein